MANIKYFFWICILSISFFFLYSVKAIITPFVISLVIAYLLNPLVNKFELLGINRKNIVTSIVFLFFSLISVLLIKLIPMLVEQIKQVINDIPTYQTAFNTNFSPRIHEFFKTIDPKLASEMQQALASASEKILGYFVNIVGGIFNSSLAILSILAFILFTPILVFYILRDWQYLVTNIHKYIPIHFHNIIFKQLSEIDIVLSAYIRGQITVCLILSSFYVIALSILGLHNSLLIGIISGCLIIIPYLGLLIGLVICVFSALIQFDSLNYAYLTSVIFLFGHIFESYIITPKLIGEKVGLNPVFIIFSLMAGGSLFGFWGVFFAIPIAAIIACIIRSLLNIYLVSHIYTDE